MKSLELLRTVISRVCRSRLREWIANHRRAPRHTAQLRVSVTLVDEKENAKCSSPTTLALNGYTRDISMTGVALIVPRIRIGERYLTAAEQRLQIACELPTGPVKLRASAVRYTSLTLDAGEGGYLIGAEITGISDGRVSLADYLKAAS